MHGNYTAGMAQQHQLEKGISSKLGLIDQHMVRAFTQLFNSNEDIQNVSPFLSMFGY